MNGRHPAPQDLDLTPRQLIVLEELAAGASYHHIARRIGLSVSTVRNEAATEYRTLGVRDRAEAATRAAELGVASTVMGEDGIAT